MKYLFFFLIILPSLSYSQINIDNIQEKEIITQELSIASSQSSSVQIQELNFRPIKSESLSIKYNNDFTWIKGVFENNTNKTQSFILAIDSSLAGTIKLFKQNEKSLEYMAQSGSEIPFYDRDYYSTIVAFKISLQPHSKEVYILQRKGIHRFDGRVFISPENIFSAQERNKEVLIFIYTGAVLALFFYNFFIGIFTGNKSYYLYSGFIFSMGGVALNLIGGFDRLMANLFPISNYLMFFSASSICFAMAFTKSFLSIKESFPWFRYIYYPILTSGLLHLILFPFLRPIVGGLMGHTIDITLMLGITSMLTIGVMSLLKGNKFARFYVASWGILFTSAFCWFAMTYEVLPQSNFTKYALLWGNIVEMLILSLGLAYRIVIIKQEKDNAEYRAKENQRYQMLLRVVLHDIANPITVVKSYSHIIEKLINKNAPLEKIKDYINKMSISVDVVSEIIQSTRYQEFELKQHKEKILQRVNLIEVFKKCEIIFEKQLKEKKVSFQFPAQDYYVIADKKLLVNNIFSNLLSNAIKFSYPNGEINIFIEDQGNNFIKTTIQDNGIGLSDQQIEEFNNKGRITSKLGTAGEKGTGYGMMLVKNYVEIFGGELILANKVEGDRKITLIHVILKQSESKADRHKLHS